MHCQLSLPAAIGLVPPSSSSSSASSRLQGPRSPTIQLSCAQASLVLPQERSPGGGVEGFYETAPVCALAPHSHPSPLSSPSQALTSFWHAMTPKHSLLTLKMFHSSQGRWCATPVPGPSLTSRGRFYPRPLSIAEISGLLVRDPVSRSRLRVAFIRDHSPSQMSPGR
eukprot:612644-Rhodomonas_salina.2